MSNCILCGWPLDPLHIFNVNCGAANAQYDQIMAEIYEQQNEPLTAEEEAIVERAKEGVRDILAQKRFERNLRGY